MQRNFQRPIKNFWKKKSRGIPGGLLGKIFGVIHVAIFLEIPFGQFSKEYFELISCRNPGGISGRNPGGIPGGNPPEVSGINPGRISIGLSGEISTEITVELTRVIL